MKKINLYLLEFALSALLRQKAKNIFILLIFTSLIFLLSSVFFISKSIQTELNTTVNALPDITIQKLKAGRHYDIDVAVVDELLQMPGIKSAVPRVWGYYYFENAGVNFSVIGIDEFEEQYKESLNQVVEKNDFSHASENNAMIVGSGVKKILNENYYTDYFNFIKSDGTFQKVSIAGTFKDSTNLESNDLILLPRALALNIFGMAENLATDIIVKVANPNEVSKIASKIKLLFPDCRVITKEELSISYQNIFDYKGGIFLLFFTISIFTFFIIVFDRISGLSSEEKKEIGILKAIGWRVEDVLKEKFYEAFTLSFSAYILGVLLALLYVYILQAPLLNNIFSGYSVLKPTFDLPFVLDINSLVLIFLLSVPIYIAAIIIPSWRNATIETDKVIR
ncbi:MAG: ABC transporter permease [Candidatus Marinarcus sp.]|uniref:ABC transporter permease n=1 Tax=Candidatus Marinarcus sp. TaxID=3100987 RepID=UPI003B00AAE5